MPEHRPAPDAPSRAVDATIERIRDALLGDCDPETLNEIRAAFRRKIPLRLRSYAAALLILEASGGGKKASRGDGRQQQKKARQEPKGRKEEEPKQRPPRADQKKEGPASDAPAALSEETRPRFEGEGTTVFFGMGKRQRLYPRVLLRILMENGGLVPEAIGDIRSFDNYSFADVDPLKAEELIVALASFAFRGRALPVNKARKRGEARPEGEGSPESAPAREFRPESPFHGSDFEEAPDEDTGSYDDNYDNGDGLSDDFTDRDEGPAGDELDEVADAEELDDDSLPK